MKDMIFLAHDPGGFDAVYPVAFYMSKKKDMKVKLILTGQAAEREPLLGMSERDTIDNIREKLKITSDFILVTGTSWDSSVELECIKLCKSSGIKTVSILDYWCNYTERFKQKDEYIYPDFLFVMDQLAFDEAKAEGINPDIMRLTGNPGLDNYVQKKIKKKKVLFISQPLSMLYSVEKTGYSEFEAFEGVLRACKELRLVPKIKFHPKETQKMMEMYQSYSVDGKVEDIACEYDVIVGMTTMGLLQCSLMGIPVISYEPDLNVEDSCIINKLGIAKGAYCYSDLLEQLKVITGSVNEENLPFWYDGRSTERCVEELIKLDC